ncbi:SAM-dependent methyltransferase [Microbacterium sp. NPDC057407]|uniref:SAM-dependent methyltransferase n=1 Tax=Microbacterium sp. NPDC057407 TaxID=3346120 RepID=UPI00366FD39F
MSAVIPVSADWLTLREPADAAARSRALADRAAGLIGSPVTVHDLGSGTGSMMRWLAPLLPTPQTWVLHDWNAALLERAARTAPPGATVSSRVGALGDLGVDDLAPGALVVTSALLDVLTAAEVEAIVRACVTARTPALLALSVDGRVGFDPVDEDDRVFERAFNDHQRREVDGRRLLGPDALPLAVAMFREAGWSVAEDESPWRLGSADGALVVEWMDGWLGAAVEETPALRARAEQFSRRRAAQLARGVLRVEVGHRDILAWPT